MTIVTGILRMQWDTLRRHPWVATCILLCVAGVLELAVRHDALPKALAYLGAMLACVFLVDLFARWKATRGALPVQHPSREAIIVISCTALG